MAEARQAIAHAERYVLGRQSPSGGFCFYRWQSVEEPNLSDTYHGVAALKRLGREPPHSEAIADFIDSAALYGPSYYYFQWMTLQLLGQTDRIGAETREHIRSLRVLTPSAAHPVQTRSWLETTLQVLTLHRALGCLTEQAHVLAFLSTRKSDGGFGDAPNLWDTWLAVSILGVLDMRDAASETAGFVDSLQRPTIGFTMTPRSWMEHMDAVYAGVMCCVALGIPIRYRDHILSFVLACQTADGGFARAPVALPDLVQTHHAIEVMLGADPDISSSA